jgi:Outer membrane protein beta-barrel domain
MLIRTSFVLGLIFILFINAHAQVTFGVKVGPDFSKLLDAGEGYNGSGSTQQLNTTTRNFFYGGIFLDIPLGKADNFYLRPQLLYMGMGGGLPEIVDYNGNQLAPNIKYWLNYLDVPLQLLYSPTLAFGKPWIGAGLYAASPISGNEKTGNSSRALVIGDSRGDDIERMDFGFSFTAGLTLKCHVLVGADFQQGLTRISPPTLFGSPRLNTRTSVWGIHVGYEWPVKHKRGGA